MGRTEPSVGKPPASFRRDVRSKRAKATANKVIPAMLAAHPRARRGVEASELIVDPPPASPRRRTQKQRKAGRDDRNPDDGEEDGGDVREREKRASTRGPRISLRVADTLEAAYPLLLVPAPSSAGSEDRRDLANTTARVGVLNMASPLSAGGGFLIGAQGQEEASLCARTTLFPSLRDEFYRLPELGVVFTPDVLVFRDVRGKRSRKARIREGEDNEEKGEIGEVKDEGRGGADEEEEVLPKPDRWFVDVVSAAMLRLPEIDVDAASGWATYANPRDRELAVSKMRAVLRVFATKGVKRIVLGAWGCGAYGNPVGEIARAWKKVLLGGGKDGSHNRDSQKKGKRSTKEKEKATESWEGIEHIVFAIKDAGMARAFATAFGEDLLERHDEDEEDLSEEGEDYDVEDAKVQELRNKIRELELRAEQARSPQLRSGLNSVLVGLRGQLPECGAIPTSCGGGRDEASEDGENGEELAEDSDELDDDQSGHESEI
ncbi:hypothetical protein F5Y05DRAFT_397241 [Hypoxylon sp. FL0543]|nr:hypothetical protein F5Y05DRAFT_397241 [Hypoxylon sp. FL0543]